MVLPPSPWTGATLIPWCVLNLCFSSTWIHLLLKLLWFVSDSFFLVLYAFTWNMNHSICLVQCFYQRCEKMQYNKVLTRSFFFSSDFHNIMYDR
jgi:hypothetical protein